MKRWIAWKSVALLVLLTGCGGPARDARLALEQYLTAVKDGRAADAYEMISEYDKRNITLEQFTAWREAADGLGRIESFSIARGPDTFRDYVYESARFSVAYGFRVSLVRPAVPDVELTDYDAPSFRIMVGDEGDGPRVVLLLTDLEARTARYRAVSP